MIGWRGCSGCHNQNYRNAKYFGLRRINVALYTILEKICDSIKIHLLFVVNVMTPIPSSARRAPSWMPILMLFIVLGVPLVWFAASLLVINPAFPGGVNHTEVRATAEYLQAHPQPTPSTIIEFYYMAASNSSGQDTCIELNMKSPQLRLQKNGYVLSGYEVKIKSVEELGFLRKIPNPFVCFVSSFPGKMTHFRLVMAESFNPLSYHVYEWATKGD